MQQDFAAALIMLYAPSISRHTQVKYVVEVRNVFVL